MLDNIINFSMIIFEGKTLIIIILINYQHRTGT